MEGQRVESSGGAEDPAIVHAQAAILAAGIGSFAMGMTVLLNEAGIWSAPPLYSPAGGVTGRVTVALVVWLLAWVTLHQAWRRHLRPRPVVYPLTIFLILLGILGTFPPIWALFG